MKKLNLLPPELKQQHELDMVKTLKKGLLYTIIFLVLAIVSFGQYKLMAMESQVTQLTEQRNSMLPLQHNKIRMEQELEQLEVQVRAYSQAHVPRVAMAQLLDDISMVMPMDIWLTKVELIKMDEKQESEDVISSSGEDGFKLLLSGYGQRVTSVGYFAHYLSHVTGVSQAQVIYGEEVTENQVQVVRFQISCWVNK